MELIDKIIKLVSRLKLQNKCPTRVYIKEKYLKETTVFNPVKYYSVSEKDEEMFMKDNFINRDFFII